MKRAHVEQMLVKTQDYLAWSAEHPGELGYGPTVSAEFVVELIERLRELEIQVARLDRRVKTSGGNA